MADDASPATKSHRLAVALATLGARVIAVSLETPDLSLPACAKQVLKGDPTLAATLDTLLQRGARGPKPAVDHPCARLFYLAQGLTDTLHKVSVTLSVGAGSPLPSEVPPSDSPLLPPHSPPPPLGRPKRTAAAADSASGFSADAERPRDALIDAWADVFAEGDYRNLSDREFGQVLKANQRLRTMAQRTGRSEEEMADGIRKAASNWSNAMSDRPMKIPYLVDNWATLVHGPQKNGRSAGVTIAHRQTLYENGSVRRERSLADLMREQEGVRRDQRPS